MNTVNPIAIMWWLLFGCIGFAVGGPTGGAIGFGIGLAISLGLDLLDRP